MELTDEQRRELSAFPAALRNLIEAELAVGNEIAEFGHSFPASPAGAFVKLVRPVSTRERASGAGLEYRQRNSSLSIGEFSDAAQLYFILEPAGPPPAEPDMDDIRKSAQPSIDPLASPPIAKDHHASLPPPLPSPAASAPGRVTHFTRRFHFRDSRAPHEIKAHLEREIMSGFTPRVEEDKLVFLSEAEVLGAHYRFRLCFESALLMKNHYSLQVEASWDGQPESQDSFFRKTSEGWIDLWTRDFRPTAAAAPGSGNGSRYRKLWQTALKAEQHLDSIPAIQHAILAAVKQGATFTTAHKEGGSKIGWNAGGFYREDYGESPSLKRYSTDEDFLNFLRRFYDWEVSKHRSKSDGSELTAWKLILRLLHQG